ncbi:MAG TPA: hypothetical protein VGJ87_14340 [Roseiflexaceae bacterium]|jgi:hypothetical protein
MEVRDEDARTISDRRGSDRRRSAGADERQRRERPPSRHTGGRLVQHDRVGGEACTSPISLCTHGTLSGDLPGSYDAVFDSLQPAGDPNDPTLNAD